MNKTTRGVAAVLAAGCLWGTTGLFVRYFEAQGIGSMEIVFLRMLVTAVAMLAGLLCVRPSLLRVKPRDSWCFLGNGIGSLLLFSFCYFQAIRLSSMAVAAVLLYTAPILVMLLSLWLFREKLNGRKLLACALSFAGCMCVAGLFGGGGATLTLPALLAGLGSGLGYALYSIFTRFALNRGYHALTVIAWSFTVACLASLPLTDLGCIGGMLAARPGVIGMVLLMGLVSAILPYLLYTYGLTCIESSRASIIASVEPVVAMLAGLVVYREIPDIWGLLGIVLVLLSLVLLNGKRRTPTGETEEHSAKSV